MTLEELVGNARAILLDFDGPIARLLPPPANRDVADRVRGTFPPGSLPASLSDTSDHLALLRHAAADPEQLSRTEPLCDDLEQRHARNAPLTEGAAALLRNARTCRLPVAVVSNNTASAVHICLTTHGLAEYVYAYACRIHERPDLMKPNPYPLHQAASELRVPIASCLFVGDSITDVQAAHSATCPMVGFGKSAQRAAELQQAGADVVTTMDHLAATLAPHDWA